MPQRVLPQRALLLSHKREMDSSRPREKLLPRGRRSFGPNISTSCQPLARSSTTTIAARLTLRNGKDLWRRTTDLQRLPQAHPKTSGQMRATLPFHACLRSTPRERLGALRAASRTPATTMRRRRTRRKRHGGILPLQVIANRGRSGLPPSGRPGLRGFLRSRSRIVLLATFFLGHL